ncbi:hypothetical protein QYE76_045595 [Lolium multiflorum]|uniref:Reverse transcriptase domain-containing protein n=1 Tax=Lolium multiflorum TaxID=4521 RepID=A0AAD8TN27_LOLMU|nr:hypothetical protein QYE76_045595 [Lolium multiflorum]
MMSPASLVGIEEPARPPGFETSPERRTPVFGDGDSPACTPSSPRQYSVIWHATAHEEQDLPPLFTAAQVPLLSSPPMSSPPIHPCPRRKTMAGTTIARTYGFSLRQAKSKANARRKTAPIAKNAEIMLCKGLGIVQDGKVITERAMNEFAKRFQGRISDDVMGAMRALFKLDDGHEDEVDEALLGHGGADTLDHELALSSVGEEAWDAPSTHHEPCQRLFHKLRTTGQALAKWGRHLFSNTKVMLHATLLVILHLDMAEEHKKLSVGEMDLRDKLKRKSVALSVIERARKKQCAWIACIKEGDANTRFFHLRVNARRRKNHIHRLRGNNNGWITEHEAKERIVHTHFKSTIARGPSRLCDFNWDGLYFEDPDLQTLGDPFSEEEVKSAISRCLVTRPRDWMDTHHCQNDGAQTHPAHSDDLVSNAQSAFIKNRSIHDNFLYVKNYATRLHKNKPPTLLFKLDIRKAFDSVRWEYIVDLLQKRGFPSTFRNWVVALLTTSTSRVLLNGFAGDPIGHGRGQGDPLSPLLFILAIDPLSQIIDIATDHGLLHKLRGRGARVRTSLYADDAAVFVAPIKEDIANMDTILERFGEVTRLCTNFQKSSVVPIRCTDLDLAGGGIPAVRASFPLTYLGLPLSVWCLKRRDMQHLEDKCASKLPTWSGKLITTAGHAALVKSSSPHKLSTTSRLLPSLPVPSSSLTRYNVPSFGPLRKPPQGRSARLIGRRFAAPRG